MSGTSSRDKGARGEREVIWLLQPIVDKVFKEFGRVPPILKRNYTQRFQSCEADVDGIPWLTLEVKRVENLQGLGSWWNQCVRATREGQVSVLAYRQNNRAWQVRMRVPIVAGETRIKATVGIDMPTFLVWFEHRLKSEMMA